MANHLSSVTTIHNGQGDPAIEPIRNISDLQRGRIAAKVHELKQATRLDERELYGVILADFGLADIGDLRRDQFKPAMEKLGRWISEVREDPTDAPAPVRRDPPCAGCTRLNSKLTRTRRWMASAACLVLLAGAAAAYVWLMAGCRR
ncbi:hypothetical protein [Ralstonia pseudosolanacearum]|uniref:hypothetical protein n=1 Tax=Ralstonia pseudosolanacearum TaxID=1310165 RepID=UPI002676CAAB|nr:hypothetical protein [Ralstonia pseudosolanacearum]MDO3508419.1 hypothetical protein [Ralstonia pseudosolanacearum]MDO3514112.1 hypothetical protein [Ralstonia pseudosolanacearum]MDO3538411.1 hypothetical protein [Ralstonia pseudosolanacearum]MDO3607351.1 hypothetical protein [Ralstonia pseudosolanacearum]MDO3612360.1 hypothetical protein [Ralstonia pseudosolanacearum]